MAKLDLTEMDVRVIEFHLRNGNITQTDYDAYRATLADDAEAGTETETAFSTPFAVRLATEGDDAASA